MPATNDTIQIKVNEEAPRHTQYVNTQQGAVPPPPAFNSKTAKPNQPKGKSQSSSGVATAAGVAAGAVGGVALGAAGVALMGATIPSDSPIEVGDQVIDDLNTQNSGLHSLVDPKVPYAESVNDNMSFADAFAAARAEVGAGGVFEWHGQLYGTYYKNEWDAMTPAQRAEYNEQFAWSKNHHDQAGGGEQAGAGGDQGSDQAGAGSEGGEEVTAEIDQAVDELTAELDPNSVDIIEATYDESTGSSVAIAEIDDQQVVMVDLDANDSVDYIGLDTNGDGVIDMEELSDVSDHGINMSDFDGCDDIV